MNKIKNMITNPILAGFHPDPSICRAGRIIILLRPPLNGSLVYGFIIPGIWFIGNPSLLH